jgi:anti-anti-sigma factor
MLARRRVKFSVPVCVRFLFFSTPLCDNLRGDLTLGCRWPRCLMADQAFKHISCPIAVLRIELAQLIGDDLADSLREEFLAARRAIGAQHIIVDFQPVTYLSSASFRPLLSLLREVRAQGGRLVLCNLQPYVHEVFTVTRLISSQEAMPAAFEVQANLTAAIASLTAAAGKA